MVGNPFLSRGGGGGCGWRAVPAKGFVGGGEKAEEGVGASGAHCTSLMTYNGCQVVILWREERINGAHIDQ
jgi:hypothetical protein